MRNNKSSLPGLMMVSLKCAHAWSLIMFTYATTYPMTVDIASKGEMYPSRATWCARKELEMQRLMGTLNPRRFKIVPRGCMTDCAILLKISPNINTSQRSIITYINCTLSRFYGNKRSVYETNNLH